MNDKISFRQYLVPTLILFVVGWGGLVLLVNFSLPTLWPRWGFYALIVLAATGTSLPAIYWFNSIFSKNSPVKSEIIIRESVGVGVYFAVLAWLNIGRALNFPISVWVGLGLFLIEYLLRLRESATKSENVPPQPPLS